MGYFADQFARFKRDFVQDNAPDNALDSIEFAFICGAISTYHSLKPSPGEPAQDRMNANADELREMFKANVARRGIEFHPEEENE